MTTLLDALVNAFHLVFSLDPDVVEYAFRSVSIALIATFIAGMFAVPLGALIAEREFRGKRPFLTVLNTLLGIPTVVVGLLVYSFINRNGPLGMFGLLFTVPGIVIGEVILILPLVTALSVAAITRVERDVRKTAMALGANEGQVLWTILRESRFGILAAVIAAFGRVIGEVGVATILGGDAARFTRTLTTSMVHYVGMGYFEIALALGIVLLTLSFTVNILFQTLQGRR
ncbi:MAG: ABC transporter permease [bacterium]